MPGPGAYWCEKEELEAAGINLRIARKSNSKMPHELWQNLQKADYLTTFGRANYLDYIYWGFQNVIKRNKRSILTSCPVRYPERDLNPHNRYGHRILSPAGLVWLIYMINNEI